MDRFKVPSVDAALIGASTIPFWGVTAPVVTLTHARVEGFFLGALAMAALCALASKPIFGWRHTAARIVLMASGLWGIVGNGHREYAIIIPGGAGTLAQYLWMAGLVLFFHTHNEKLKAGILEELPAAAATPAAEEQPGKRIRLIR